MKFKKHYFIDIPIILIGIVILVLNLCFIDCFKIKEKPESFIVWAFMPCVASFIVLSLSLSREKTYGITRREFSTLKSDIYYTLSEFLIIVGLTFLLITFSLLINTKIFSIYVLIASLFYSLYIALTEILFLTDNERIILKTLLYCENRLKNGKTPDPIFDRFIFNYFLKFGFKTTFSRLISDKRNNQKEIYSQLLSCANQHLNEYLSISIDNDFEANIEIRQMIESLYNSGIELLNFEHTLLFDKIDIFSEFIIKCNRISKKFDYYIPLNNFLTQADVIFKNANKLNDDRKLLIAIYYSLFANLLNGQDVSLLNYILKKNSYIFAFQQSSVEKSLFEYSIIYVLYIMFYTTSSPIELKELLEKTLKENYYSIWLTTIKETIGCSWFRHLPSSIEELFKMNINWKVPCSESSFDSLFDTFSTRSLINMWLEIILLGKQKYHNSEIDEILGEIKSFTTFQKRYFKQRLETDWIHKSKKYLKIKNSHPLLDYFGIQINYPDKELSRKIIELVNDSEFLKNENNNEQNGGEDGLQKIIIQHLNNHYKIGNLGKRQIEIFETNYIIENDSNQSKELVHDTILKKFIFDFNQHIMDLIIRKVGFKSNPNNFNLYEENSPFVIKATKKIKKILENTNIKETTYPSSFLERLNIKNLSELSTNCPEYYPRNSLFKEGAINLIIDSKSLVIKKDNLTRSEIDYIISNKFIFNDGYYFWTDGELKDNYGTREELFEHLNEITKKYVLSVKFVLKVAKRCVLIPFGKK